MNIENKNKKIYNVKDKIEQKRRNTQKSERKKVFRQGVAKRQD